MTGFNLGIIDSIFSTLLGLILKFVSSVLVGILSPIDNLILLHLPDLSNAFTSVGNLMAMLVRPLGWVISLTGLSAETLSLIAIYYGFKLTAPILFSAFKLAVKWYHKLVP